MTPGAAYIPDCVTVPTVELPPTTPFTFQVMVLGERGTYAVNWRVVPFSTLVVVWYTTICEKAGVTAAVAASRGSSQRLRELHCMERTLLESEGSRNCNVAVQIVRAAGTGRQGDEVRAANRRLGMPHRMFRVGFE
jgi:hypothetical protein